jgi:transcriptional regulator with XRE-family HTH domain
MRPRRDPEVDKQLGARIRVVRASAGLTQERLAERLGVETLSVSRFETGRRGVSIPTLFRIADALGVKVQDLLDVDVPARHVAVSHDALHLHDALRVFARLSAARQAFALRFLHMLEDADPLD